MRLALIGRGRMARAVERLAVERGHTIATVIGSGENAAAAAITAERMAGIELAIEFTRPDAAFANLAALARLRIPTVTGTTGWLDQLPDLSRLVAEHRSALLYAANFSVGVQLFLRAAMQLARTMRGRDIFDGFVSESHHAAKHDAPSGTALALATALRRSDAERSYPVSSLRGGHDVGTHRVTYDAPFETIQLEHQARNRDVFAAGALAAAEWLPGHLGVFTFDQMLFGADPV
jgi:4-hydroxy-tetrahydrodipicolinate reductase